MADPKSETLNAGTITESLGMVGSALSNDSTDQPNSDSGKLELQEFLKQLVSSTTELASQFEELTILQKDMILDERRKTAEELSELKAGEKTQQSSLIEPLNGLTEAIDRLTKLIEETDFNSSLGIPIPTPPRPDRKGGKPKAPTAPAGAGGAAGGASPFEGRRGGAAGLGSKALGAFGALMDFGNRTVLGGQSLTQAGVGVGGSVAGGLASAELGAVLGGFTGPAAPVAVPVLSILFGTAGYYLGGLGADKAYDTVTGSAEQPAIDKPKSAPVKQTQISSATPARALTKPVTITPQPPQTQRPIDSASSNLNQSVLAKTEELEKSESTVEVASPIVAGQSSNQPQQPLKATITNFGMSGVNEVPDPNYNGGILESELYP